MEKQNKVRITAYLSPKMRDDMAAQAEAEGCSESVLVARAVMTYLELRKRGDI